MVSHKGPLGEVSLGGGLETACPCFKCQAEEFGRTFVGKEILREGYHGWCLCRERASGQMETELGRQELRGGGSVGIVSSQHCDWTQQTDLESQGLN